MSEPAPDKPVRTALLITDDKAASITIRNIVKKYGVEINTSYLNLNSTAMIKKIILKTGNTAFMRADLYKLITEIGVPFLVSLDYTIDLALDDALDPDRRKILRTLLISYIILAKAQGLEHLQANFMVLYRSAQAAHVRPFEANPAGILDILYTGNTKANEIINELKGDPARFNRLFQIRFVNISQTQGEIDAAIRAFITGLETREKLFEMIARKKNTDLEQEHKTAAQIVYRIDRDTVYVDGETSEIPKGSPYLDFSINEFYAVGSWEQLNQLAVADKLKKAITGGIGEKSFKPADPIVLNLGDDCLIDGATANSLARLFVQELGNYKDVKIYVNSDNAIALEKSKGFIIIKNLIRHSY
ncbi:MAG TPA: hypothetical protein PLE73_09430 [Spirochaetota bacterium]|nr:hypothetical protein [Spirochaetota bacterium]